MGFDHRSHEMNSPPLVSQPCLSVLEPGGFAPPPPLPGHLHLPTVQMLPEAVGANVLLLPMRLKGKLLEAPHALNGFAVMNVQGHGDSSLLFFKGDTKHETKLL